MSDRRLNVVSRLVHDLEIVLRDGSRRIIRGLSHAPAMAQVAITAEVPVDLFRQWLKDFKDFGPVSDGLIAEHTGDVPSTTEGAYAGDADQQAADALADKIEAHLNP